MHSSERFHDKRTEKAEHFFFQRNEKNHEEDDYNRGDNSHEKRHNIFPDPIFMYCAQTCKH
jgi:hypothetical protein